MVGKTNSLLKLVLLPLILVLSLVLPQGAGASIESKIATSYSNQFLHIKLNSYIETYLNRVGQTGTTSAVPHLGTHVVRGISFILAGYHLTQGKTDRDRFWGTLHLGGVVHPALGLYVMGAQLSELALGIGHRKKMMKYNQAIMAAIETQMRLERERLEAFGRIYQYHLQGLHSASQKLEEAGRVLSQSPMTQDGFSNDPKQLEEWLTTVQVFLVQSRIVVSHLKALHSYQCTEISQIFGPLPIDPQQMIIEISQSQSALTEMYDETLKSYGKLLASIALDELSSKDAPDPEYELCHRKRMYLKVHLIKKVGEFRRRGPSLSLLDRDDLYAGIESMRSDLLTLQPVCDVNNRDQDLLDLLDYVEERLYDETKPDGGPNHEIH
ncbi:MAG: hypothetical protein H6624_09430 [Bdellovibrionaceae bacterium]|nr:hypothetical protein [Pseudobdellovibrionaceae bacterium]